MLKLHQVSEVQALITQGLSQRQIAKQLGVSRGSVCTIGAGKWTPRTKKEPVDRPLLPPIRCPTCRAHVHPPCIACSVRKSLGVQADSGYTPQKFQQRRNGSIIIK
jgi:hypothetical protein